MEISQYSARGSFLYYFWKMWSCDVMNYCAEATMNHMKKRMEEMKMKYRYYSASAQKWNPGEFEKVIACIIAMKCSQKSNFEDYWNEEHIRITGMPFVADEFTLDYFKLIIANLSCHKSTAAEGIAPEF